MGYSDAISSTWLTAATDTIRARPGPAPVRMPAAPSDALSPIIARMAAGEESALSALYEATVARLYGIALRICGNAALAEEVVVDTLHQAWREARRYDATRGAPLAWLLMMCRSRALDALRSRDPAMAHEDPASLVDELQDARGDPFDLLCSVESSGALHGALVKLSPSQRQMVALAFFRGLTHEEIAAHTALPLGTVKSQIRRALDALRRTLGAENER